MVNSYNRIPLSNKKKQNTAPWNIWINHKMAIEIIMLVGSINCRELPHKCSKKLSGLMEMLNIVWTLGVGYTGVHICQNISNCTYKTEYKLCINFFKGHEKKSVEIKNIESECHSLSPISTLRERMLNYLCRCQGCLFILLFF